MNSAWLGLPHARISSYHSLDSSIVKQGCSNQDARIMGYGFVLVRVLTCHEYLRKQCSTPRQTWLLAFTCRCSCPTAVKHHVQVCHKLHSMYMEVLSSSARNQSHRDQNAGSCHLSFSRILHNICMLSRANPSSSTRYQSRAQYHSHLTVV